MLKAARVTRVRRRFLAASMAVTLLFASAGLASALSLGINPSTQNHAHGVQSSWMLTWGGGAPYTVFFAYDNNVPSWNWTISGTSTVSKSLSATYYPCATTTFTQRLNVIDGSGAGGTVFSTAKELGGLPC